MNKEEELHRLEITNFPFSQQFFNQLQPFSTLFEIGSQFELKSKYKIFFFFFLKKKNSFNRDWTEGPMKKVQPEQIENETSSYVRQLYKLEKTFQSQNQDSAKTMAFTIRKNVEDFRINMRVINTFFNPGLRDRHWNEMNSIAEIYFKPDKDTNLLMILDSGLPQYINKLEPISEAASKELKIENDINNICKQWNEIKFQINSFRDTGSFVFASVEEIQVKIDDDLSKLLVLKSSKFVEPFKDKIEDIENKLKNLQDLFDKLIQIQAEWIYLEPIFSSIEIVNQMPESDRRFSRLNKIWHEILLELNENPHCFELLNIEKIFEKLEEISFATINSSIE